MAGPSRGASHNPDLMPGDPHRMIGIRLREARIAARLGYKELAAVMRRAGWRWTAETVNTIQTGRGRSSGHGRRLYAAELPALARILGVTVDYLLSDVVVNSAARPPDGVPLSEVVADWETVDLDLLTQYLRLVVARLVRTPADARAQDGEDIREAASYLIPVVLRLEETGAPVLSWEVVDVPETARKLSVGRATEIRVRLGLGESGVVLAEEFGVHPSTISRVGSGELYGAAAVPAFERGKGGQ